MANNLSKLGQEYLFELSITQILSNHDDSEYSCNKLFKTNDQNKDYILLLLYYHLVQNNKTEEANNILIRRWSQIDTMSWNDRLKSGDETVMREMLIGYYLGKEF